MWEGVAKLPSLLRFISGESAPASCDITEMRCSRPFESLSTRSVCTVFAFGVDLSRLMMLYAVEPLLKMSLNSARGAATAAVSRGGEGVTSQEGAGVEEGRCGKVRRAWAELEEPGEVRGVDDEQL